MGISFYTFQTLSYTIDVYRKQREPEYHLGYFALYVTFFPQLVAGPIERSDRLIPQLRKVQTFDYGRTLEGLQRMVWGFFKKVVIADNLAVAVNHVYGNVESASGLTLLIATGFFAYQIYCDFSGYSDIAIGSAKILGIDLMENFKRPYFSTSIKEFWSRWHISLSTWFRDYVYIPLGGSKKGSVRTYVNVLIVFLISGLWHGASWMFVIWGAIHGFYQLYEKATFNIRDRFWMLIRLDGTWIQKFVKWFITMSVVLISWVFFRAGSLNEVLSIFTSFGDDLVNGNLFNDFISLIQMNQIGLGLGAFRLVVLILSVLILEMIQIFKEYYPETAKNLWLNAYLRYVVFQLLVLWILLFGQFGLQEFIYFQF
jgi:D-alanyl-lipoteichoic acid acyltransferase DltB (MBOAT superfamily)